MIKLLVPALLALSAFLIWRHWSRKRRHVFIANFPYQEFLDKRLAGRRPELTDEQRTLVLAALQDYFQMCRIAGRRMVAMPSQVVDDAWHELILFTRYYEKFCRGAFGRFLHHTPAEAMSGPTQASEGIRRAWRLACAQEKIDPMKPERLPRLFAIDAALGIAGGFVYQLDCMTGPLGNGYCASHIGCSGSSGGCGGGCSGDSGSADGGGDGGSGCGGGCGGGGD